MNDTNNMNKPPMDVDATLKDSIACGAVLASMLLTMACGAFVVDAGTDPSPRHAQATGDTGHE
jgi:hypothetical protein